ncbi:glycosyltransferase [Devosia sp.]|uniref:glycosyltransferase n=1 Tax=Devosia sp. TaxID=1871048 RepID=UPI003BA91BCD
MLTLIIPARNWSQDRIDYCVRSFTELGSKWLSEFVIVDFGSAVPITAPDSTLPVRLLRLEAAVWSSAEATNAGVLVAQNSVVAKADADFIISRRSRAEFDAMAEGVANGTYGLAIGQACDLPSGVSTDEAYELISKSTKGTSTLSAQALGRLRPRWGQGGLVIFTRSRWDRIGGYESRFTGWGNEDNDFAERMRFGGAKTYWGNRSRLELFHIWHAPSVHATGVVSLRNQNQKLAKDDKSVFRRLAFRHSNFPKLATPQILSGASPLVTLAVATSARPGRDRMILEAINSFRGQIDNDFEVVVVDNGSPASDSLALEKTLAKIRWTKLRLETTDRASIPAARNAISQMARGRYTCVVDDDDIALPNRLADHMLAFRKDGNVHGSHGGWIDFDESSGIIERNQGKRRSIATLMRGTGKVTAHPACLYRTDVMRAVPYDESFQLGSDLDLALRLANNGFDVVHTGTYLTLRRFHSTNVTITGQSNQVSGGATARSRVLASFDWARIGGLEEEAKANDAEVYCRNPMSIDSLAEMIPGYTGSWRVLVPVAALRPDEGLDAELLEQLSEIIEGDLFTRRAGLNQPIYFRSVPVTGLKKGRRIKEEAEALVGVPLQLNSVRQTEIDRAIPFDWKAMNIKPGERVLRSERYSELAELLVLLSGLDPSSLLRSLLSVLSDHDEDGDCYYLVTAPLKGYDDLRQTEFELERQLKIPFRHIASNGLPNELTLSQRSH